MSKARIEQGAWSDFVLAHQEDEFTGEIVVQRPAALGLRVLFERGRLVSIGSQTSGNGAVSETDRARAIEAAQEQLGLSPSEQPSLAVVRAIFLDQCMQRLLELDAYPVEAFRVSRPVKSFEAVFSLRPGEVRQQRSEFRAEAYSFIRRVEPAQPAASIHPVATG